MPNMNGLYVVTSSVTIKITRMEVVKPSVYRTMLTKDITAIKNSVRMET